MQTPKSLLEMSRGGGCGCKIAPDDLARILLSQQRSPSFSRLLRGHTGAEDAAVWDLDGKQCLISTVDFFYPVVNDALLFGRIAAVNALSDVYAMGGAPVMALAILGWPVASMGTDAAAMVMEGARLACEDAGVPLAGGHSVESLEPFFGLSVNGLVPKNNLKRNNTACPGDHLFLSKPLGNGLCAAAHKRGLLKEGIHFDAWINNMTQLNKVGTLLGGIAEVTALTDVTGFGLLGHALEMAASGLTLMIRKESIPVLPAAKEYAGQMIYPDLTTKLFSSYSDKTKGMDGLDFLTYCDPQTSGGLLFTISPDGMESPEFKRLRSGPEYGFVEIGKVEASPDGRPLVSFIS